MNKPPRSRLSRLRAALGGRRPSAERGAFQGTGEPSVDGSGAPAIGRVSKLAFALTSLAGLATALALLAGPASRAAAQADSCPNAEFRTGPDHHLPDCRAYEQVSPVDKDGYDIAHLNNAVAPSGDAITYQSQGAFAGAHGASAFGQYLSARGPSGWSTEGITPALTQGGGTAGANYVGFSSDLSHMAFKAPRRLAPPPGPGFYRRDPDGSLTRTIPVGNPDGDYTFVGAFADYSRMFFESIDNLTPDSQGLPTGSTRRKLYAWSNGTLSLVSKLPDGTASLGNVDFRGANAVSADGARIYWYPTGRFQGPIYLSEGAGPSRLVSGDESGTPQTATLGDVATDGSLAYLTSAARLTADASPAGTDLYHYDAQSHELTDLTPTTTSADVQGIVGSSDDGSYLYFVASGNLAGDATAGQPNLYLRHGGTTTFIATLATGDSRAWRLDLQGNPWRRSTKAQVSADGRHLLFTSEAPTSQIVPGSGYDNAGHSEIYLYDAGAGGLTCVSCNPSGAAATANAALVPGTFAFGMFGCRRCPGRRAASG